MVRLHKGNTRKFVEKHTKAMTIPELRRAFEKIEDFTKKNSKDVEGFRKLWKKTFGKEVSKQSAEDYLAFVSANPSSTKQTGGGAPLDYTTRPGAELPYGSFLKYVAGGMAPPMDSFGMLREDITPRISADMGTNTVNFSKGGGKRNRVTRRKQQKGGGMYPALAEMLTRPFLMNSPPSAAQDLQMVSKGIDSLPSPRPEINDLSSTKPPAVFTASAATLPNTL